ncbi:hypothetical protein [Rufibacter latericius]|uniref:hypothetical protein n=1 Tax=Rufibacter latericius TaxID=2487040 RepID=UPI000F628CE8|nr:hypothetical protein [Rufibacter latericius]
MKRFDDTGESYYDFLNKRIVYCPSCSCPVDLVKNRIACLKCGFNKAFSRILLEGDLKLFLEVECCGHLLWAVNIDHLNFLESYVESSLRERIPNINQSMASRLPNWIKDAKNRIPIHKCIKKLREELIRSNYIPNNQENNLA